MNLWELFLGFLVGYVYASLLESYFHDKVNDAPRSRVEEWKSQPRLIAWFLTPMVRTHFSHHTIHHCRTYRQDHIHQFRSDAEKLALDEELETFQHGREVKAAHYGNKFSFWGWIAFCSPLVPGLFIALTFFSLSAGIGVFLAVMLPPIMSNYVHEYLHLPTRKAIEQAPWPISWFARTSYFRFIARHHFLHHRYCRYNFNLVLGGDIWRGKFRGPSENDREEMRRIGLD